MSENTVTCPDCGRLVEIGGRRAERAIAASARRETISDVDRFISAARLIVDAFPSCEVSNDGLAPFIVEFRSVLARAYSPRHSRLRITDAKAASKLSKRPQWRCPPASYTRAGKLGGFERRLFYAGATGVAWGDPGDLEEDFEPPAILDERERVRAAILDAYRAARLER